MAARSSQRQPGAARDSQEKPGKARSSQEQSEAAKQSVDSERCSLGSRLEEKLDLYKEKIVPFKQPRGNRPMSKEERLLKREAKEAEEYNGTAGSNKGQSEAAKSN